MLRQALVSPKVLYAINPSVSPSCTVHRRSPPIPPEVGFWLACASLSSICVKVTLSVARTGVPSARKSVYLALTLCTTL